MFNIHHTTPTHLLNIIIYVLKYGYTDWILERRQMKINNYFFIYNSKLEYQGQFFFYLVISYYHTIHTLVKLL